MTKLNCKTLSIPINPFHPTGPFLAPRLIYLINPLIPDAHYGERRAKLASLQNKLLEGNR